MELLAVTVFLLVILRFVFRIRENKEVSETLTWIALPLLVTLVVLHFGPRFFPSLFGVRQDGESQQNK